MGGGGHDKFQKFQMTNNLILHNLTYTITILVLFTINETINSSGEFDPNTYFSNQFHILCIIL